MKKDIIIEIVNKKIMTKLSSKLIALGYSCNVKVKSDKIDLYKNMNNKNNGMKREYRIFVLINIFNCDFSCEYETGFYVEYNVNAIIDGYINLTVKEFQDSGIAEQYKNNPA